MKKKNIYIVLITVVLFIFLNQAVGCNKTTEPEINRIDAILNYTFLESYDAYEVSSSTTMATHISIPSLYQGRPVIKIANNGFRGLKKIIHVTIPTNVTTIEHYAFSG